jgi:hypothetical protein
VRETAEEGTEITETTKRQRPQRRPSHGDCGETEDRGPRARGGRFRYGLRVMGHGLCPHLGECCTPVLEDLFLRGRICDCRDNSWIWKELRRGSCGGSQMNTDGRRGPDGLTDGRAGRATCGERAQRVEPSEAGAQRRGIASLLRIRVHLCPPSNPSAPLCVLCVSVVAGVTRRAVPERGARRVRAPPHPDPLPRGGEGPRSPDPTRAPPGGVPRKRFQEPFLPEEVKRARNGTDSRCSIRGKPVEHRTSTIPGATKGKKKAAFAAFQGSWTTAPHRAGARKVSSSFFCLSDIAVNASPTCSGDWNRHRST